MLNFGQVKQLGYLTNDIEAAMESWSKNAGVGPFVLYKNITLNMLYKGQPSAVNLNVGIAYRGDMQIELIQQLNDAPSPYKKYFNENRMGLHHIAFVVDDMQQAITDIKDQNLDVIATIDGNGAGNYAYYEDPSLPDVIYEILEVPEGILEYWGQMKNDAEHWDGKPSVTVLDMTA